MSSLVARPAGQRFIENLAYLVPCYQGYKNPATRREEDSRLRAKVLSRLGLIRGTMADILTDVGGIWPLLWITRMDCVIHRLDNLADAIRYAPFGFSGFFDAPHVREESLERILESDLLVLGDLEDIEEILPRFTASPLSREAYRALMEELEDPVVRFEQHLILRDKALGDV